jgi:septum site-determining protein MinD
MSRFIGIASGKGGVGRTTTALNLALALHQFGRDVVLVDCHLSAPHIALHLGASKIPKTIHHALRKEVNVKDAAYQHESGLRLVPGEIHSENHNVEEIKETLLDLIGTGEIVIIDMAPSGQETLEVMKSLDDMFIIATPDLPSVAEALKTIRKAKELGVNILGIILNKVHNDDLELDVTSVETLTDTRVVGVVPSNKSFREALKAKQPLLYSHPNEKASKEYKRIASKLIGKSK